MENDTRESRQNPNADQETRQFRKLLTTISLVGIFGGLVLGAGIGASTGSPVNVGLGLLVGCLVALAVMIILSVRRNMNMRSRRG